MSFRGEMGGGVASGSGELQEVSASVSGKNILPTPCESLRGGHCNVLLTPMRGGSNRRCYEFSSYKAGGL